MNRREEVEILMDEMHTVDEWTTLLIAKTRTLADEVDAERAIVTKLLEMLLPGDKCPCDCIGDIGPECYCHNSGSARDAEAWYTAKVFYNRALEIAGRKE